MKHLLISYNSPQKIALKKFYAPRQMGIKLLLKKPACDEALESRLIIMAGTQFKFASGAV